MRLLLLVMLASLAMTSCAPGESTPAPDRKKADAPPRAQLPGPTPPDGTRPPPPSDAEPTRLEVTVVLEEGAAPRTATLTCARVPRATGFIEDAMAACQAVDQWHRFLLEGPPPDRACTMIYGGPQVATVTGTLGGRPVHREITRTNGCGISDWSALVALLGSP